MGMHMTLLEVLQSTTAYFKKREIESPRLNAEHLLAHVLDRRRIELYLEFERVLAEEELAPLREFVRRRGQGEPLQHLLGTVEFCGRIFKCDPRALVPRPETEELVEFIIQSSINHQPSTILDVGTGSGVIGLSLATHFPAARVDAIDISDDALALACENAERLGLSGRVQFTKGDLLERFSERFDLIAANLPYVSTQDRQSLSREVLRDPEVAVFGGDRGDELIRKLIEQAPKHLRPNGLLALEIGIGQSEALFELLTQKNYHDIESKNDYAGIPRFLFARYG
jgi:release factor glutamine methyltransferase